MEKTTHTPNRDRFFAPNVFLIGARCSGKSTLGYELANASKRGFADTDRMVEGRAHMSIAEMVAESGWDAFRRREHEVLAELCKRMNTVVSCGGGIILLQENRDLLKQHGIVIYLQASPEVLIQRLRAAPLPGQRPALTDSSQEEEMRRIVQEREPLYTETANHIVDASQPLETLVKEIIPILKKASS